MKSGYDQFFKQVRKNAGVGQRGVPLKSSVLQKQQPQKKIGQSVDSSQLAIHLREKMLQKTRAKKKKKTVPWNLAGISLVGLIVAVLGLQYSHEVENFVKKIEISVLGTAMAEEKAPVAEKPVEKKVAGDKEKSQDVAVAPAKKEFTQEELNHFAKMNERKKELDAREEELLRMESELQAQKAELEKKIQELGKTRREISSALEEKVKSDDKKVETLVQMYSNMKPQQAAKIFETMDDDLAIEILGRMKKKPAAEILNLVKAEKAQVLSEKFAGYRKK
ncbi:MAG: hypothetical protein BroJett040_13850 [Oligoflexia bacterium]|nr:MAG: hypothetical protein BroJett040_13850 [Oligoflexia bacterium]